MNFFYPRFLWLFLLLLPYLILLPIYYRKQLSVLHLLCRHNLTKEMIVIYRKYFNIMSYNIVLFFISMVLSLAKPLWGYNNRIESRIKGLQIVFILDISRSMLARDVPPSRLQRAIQLIGELYEAFPNEELGLVVFKGRAQTLIPLSHDRLVFPSVFPQLNTDILQAPGSKLSPAIAEGIRQFDNKSNSSQIMILISDGEAISDEFDFAQEQLDNWEGTLISIGNGTLEGSELLDPDGNLITNYYGLPVQSQLQDFILKDLSRRTSGKYYHIQELNLAQKLQNELTPLARSDYILEYNLQDHYQIFVIFALFFFLITAMLKRFGFMGFYQLIKSKERYLLNSK